MATGKTHKSQKSAGQGTGASLARPGQPRRSGLSASRAASLEAASSVSAPGASPARTIEAFECVRCGRCCTGAGFVNLEADECPRIAEFLGLTLEEFLDRYTRHEPGYERWLVDGEGPEEPCVFLVRDADGLAGCRIQGEAKPVQCRTFPMKWRIPGFKRKAVRVIVYKGSGRVDTIREQKGNKGYASGFEGLIQFINTLLPMNEVIEKALRKNVTMYPEISVRELVVNAIIHQDFYITGAGPMIEIFDDRMEITNPGKPLVATDRFLDSPPRSRNEMLASFMRRIGVCEERGSGIDKVIFQTELYQLPAPVFETTDDNTRAILFSHKSFSDMNREDRIRACYQHSCLKYVSRQYMTNTSLRERFGIKEQNSAMASRIIKDTVEKNLIHLSDPEASRKYTKYVPYWG